MTPVLHILNRIQTHNHRHGLGAAIQLMGVWFEVLRWAGTPLASKEVAVVCDVSSVSSIHIASLAPPDLPSRIFCEIISEVVEVKTLISSGMMAPARV